ncbi:MAG: YeeE/YedE family protein [Rhodobacteraceae bacterium]|nr:YeeE/YedE family protein [Paracoccaceae bacterium]
MATEWLWGFAGGLMIGLAAALFLLINGRIMGASGILGGLIDRTGWATAAERGAFVAGLALLPFLLVQTALPGADTRLTDNPAVIVAAGLLVGVGTRLANGCTSGHGVCGISRLSLRGIVATVFYLLAGGMAVLAFRHLLGVI